MDWSKVDAGLAAALADGVGSDRYVVFVHAVRRRGATEEPIRTATLTGEEVERLSERTEIGQIRLSRVLRLKEPT